MCYEAGLWQAYLDRELDPQLEGLMAEHLNECSSCRQIISELKEQQEIVGTILNQYREETKRMRYSSSLGWDTFVRKEGNKNLRKRGLDIMGQIKSLSYKKVAAAVAVIVLGASLGIAPVRSAAAQFLQVFRAERLTTVSLSYQEIREMQQAISKGVGQVDLNDLGTIEFITERKTKTGSIEEIKSSSDYPVKTPEYLPVDYKPGEGVIESDYSVVFDLDVEKANQVIRTLGGEKLLPAEAAGKKFVVIIPQAVNLNYYETASNKNISLTQAKSPQLNIAGDVDIKALREAVLELPVLPPSLKSKLAGINDWQHTLVIPDVEGTSHEVTVNGAQGIYIQHGEAKEVKVEFQDGDVPEGARTVEVNGHNGIVTEGEFSSTITLIWEENDMIYALNGPLELSEALRIAESVR